MIEVAYILGTGIAGFVGGHYWHTKGAPWLAKRKAAKQRVASRKATLAARTAAKPPVTNGEQK